VGVVDDFFRPWERDAITSFQEINEVILEIFDRWIAEGRLFASFGAVEAVGVALRQE
jgi:hypothetical protein